MASTRWFLVVVAFSAALAVVLGGLLLSVLDVGSIAGRDVDVLSVSVVVGLLGLVIGAMIANALAGPGGPQGPEGLTGADRRSETNDDGDDDDEDGDEWNDPPGVDATWNEDGRNWDEEGGDEEGDDEERR